MRTIGIVLSSTLLWSVLWAQETGNQKSAPSSLAPAAEVKNAEAKNQTAVAPTPGGESGLVVARAAVAAGLDENEPVDAADSFPAGIKKLYCFSQIKGAHDSATVEHRWYWNDDLILTIPLDIRSANWRTYSTKNIYPGMTGEWMVAIVNTHGEEVLKTLKFKVE